MLLIDASRRVEEIEKEIRALATEHASLSLYVKQQTERVRADHQLAVNKMREWADSLTGG